MNKDHRMKMKRLAPFFFMAILVSASVACMTVSRMIFDATPTPIPSPVIPTLTPTLIPSPTPIPTASSTPDSCPNGDCITACKNQLQDITQASGTGDGSKSVPHQVDSDEGITLLNYSVVGDQIENPIEAENIPKNLRAYQQDRLAHQNIWNYFAAIIPPERRSFLSEYVIFTDGEDNILAWVSQSENDLNKWALNVDILDSSNPQDLTFTLIHEYGHLLTLNPLQVLPSQAIFDNPDSDAVFQREADACPTYFTGEGCSEQDAYINKFVNRFWTDIYNEWSDIDSIEDEDAYYDALDSFYQKYQDQFVNDYAATDPVEDIAESFAYFILEPKPTGESIAEQKIRFFYEFPELVQLRGQIGHRLCDQLTK